MAETTADIGFGVILKKETGTPGTYADWGLEITNITPPGVSRSAIDATHMQSPDGYAEMIFGIKTTKPFPITFNWLPANTQDLVDAIEAGKQNWQFLFPDESTCTVAAGLTEFSISDLTPDGKMTGTATFTPSGKATWA